MKIAEVRDLWNVCQSYTIRYIVILLVKLSDFSLLEANISFRRIYQDNQSLPNDLKSKFKIFNLGVDFI